MNHAQQIAEKLEIPHQSVKNTLELLESENTIPFIARYRKEMTGNLDEVQIRTIHQEWLKAIALERRRETVLNSIQSQGLLTDKLESEIVKASTQTELEDLYQPYRPKRRTRAGVARKKGLLPLAQMIIQQTITDEPLEKILSNFINDDVSDIDSALQGAKDIVAEIISEHAQIRQVLREAYFRYGLLTSTQRAKSEDPQGRFHLYYQFSLPVSHLKHHQVLAMNRGEKENILQISLQINEKYWQKTIENWFPQVAHSVFCQALADAAMDGAQRLLLPAIERDIRRSITEQAEEHAIGVFGKNLKALLTQPPLEGHTVLGIDPGFRTGSKIAIVDHNGKLLETTTIYPHPPQNKVADARKIIEKLIEKYHVDLVVIGNGTASRQTELLVAELIKDKDGIHYLITSEAGASVYSASVLARRELPNLDVSMRGAVSIARRVQDPLAELVKIDPKSIGVGMYQHDVNQTRLSEALDEVVESVVNEVGVEVNTASSALLAYVSGIGPKLAEKIVAYREVNGSFKNREMFKDVPSLGSKSFEQCAGFLRVRNSTNPFDSTGIHPESYPVAEKLLHLLSLSSTTNTKNLILSVNTFKQNHNLEGIANNLNVGINTLHDILDEIARPGRDPRENLPKPHLRKDVLKVEDLTPGIELMGTIRNVVDFGAFIDIGVDIDGLLHQSRIKKGTYLNIGKNIKVIVLDIDKDRGRISLGMTEST